MLNRGAKRSPIVKDVYDKWRFLKILRHLNDEFISDRWEEDIKNKGPHNTKAFDRPISWPKQKPLVMILAYTLMPNHFHILVKEITEGGVSKFMQKLGNSMTGHFNLKYKESGSIFQGSYKARCIDDDYLRYLGVYIMVKNVFELYPGGIKNAAQNFEKAFDWAVSYQFSSLTDYANSAQVRPAQKIIQKEILDEIFPSPKDFKSFAKECILGKIYTDEDSLSLLTMEPSAQV